MNQEIYTDILYSIKTDSLILFSNAIEGNENISFGRFPILSLCYLYNAKKIIKQHEKTLLKIKEYTQIPENYEIYQKFRMIAGRSLRLYIRDESIVSPIEMLAILHRDSKVKKLYRFLKIFDLINPTIVANLESIYTIHKQHPKTSELKIKFSPRPLSNYQKRLSRNIIAIALSFTMTLMGFVILINFSTGLGTAWNPYKIQNEKQLLRALESDGNYILTRDITINSDISDKKLLGNIDGNNYTITLTELPIDGIIDTNEGKIHNLNIIVEEISSSTDASISLLVSQNNGTIENISIVCKKLKLECNKNSNNDIFVSGVATNNSGTISNCNIQINCEITTKSTGECVISGIAGNNSGAIRDCIVKENSSISATEGDIAGICSTNESNGKIENCKNYSKLSQTSNIDEWTPTIGGITLTNYGAISYCTNYGELTNISENQVEDASGNIFLGGISALNYGRISKCINNGSLRSSSKRIISYVGGITGYSQYWDSNGTTIYPLIDGCGANGIINVQAEHEKAYSFAGGICGSIYYGEISNCYSLSTFANDYLESKLFFGTFIGSAHLQYQLWNSYVCLDASNNYVLSLSNVDFQLGSLIYNNSISKGGDMSAGIISLPTADQIKSQGVYWNNEE